MKKTINPSLLIYLHNQDNLIGDAIKPVSKIKTNSLPAEIANEISEEQLEAWKCKARTTYKTQFVYEFTDYPYRVLNELGMKAYGFIKHHKLKFHTDEFTLSIEDIMTELSIKKTAAYNVIKHLLDVKIIFKTDYKDVFYINVLIVFKGNIKRLLDIKLNNDKLIR